MLRVVKSIEAVSRVVVARCCREEGIKCYYFMGTEF
jgi:hypothetical protein